MTLSHALWDTILILLEAEQKAWELRDWDGLKIFDFFKSDFSYLPLGKTRKVGCLKIPDFSESDLLYLALGKTRKAGCEKIYNVRGFDACG